jgi:hypothetical protein
MLLSVAVVDIAAYAVDDDNDDADTFSHPDLSSLLSSDLLSHTALFISL